ncbi:feruloyl esterase-like protein, partial [Wolfiporia cocos MD-104 SS10]
VAGVSTDTGHTSDVSSADWAGPGNDNAIVDWSWRAMHLSIVTGKEVVKQYYGQAHNKSYYMGCSIGRLKEVQTFPEDFDGVIVGSPANWQTHLQAWGVHMDVEVLPANSSRFIKASLWDNVIHPEVLRQCDALDGLKDHIISDPRYCIFRPETLTCRPGQNVSTCLTIPQIDALHHLYADYYETNQTWIFGGYVPGGEKAYPHGYIRDKPFAVAEEWFQYFVLNDTKWTINQYNASLVWLSDTIDPGQANAISPNLTAFAGPKHNGKLLHYVGWADQIISPGSSLHYYETVHAFTRANTDMNIDDFYRLFTVAGMNHCEGGYGGNAFGGVQQTSDDMPPLSLDPEHNILAAMVQWVENGTAPLSVIGVHWKNNTAKDGVGFTRPLCQYPKTLRYTGSDPSSAESFSCV